MLDVLEGYQQAADARFIARYESISSDAVYAPVREYLPGSPVRIADIGAGTGRDAGWFAAQGHTVTAVEPVEALREAGKRRHRDQDIAWVDDRLPTLRELACREPFHLLTLCGVWQHLDDTARVQAMPVLAGLLELGGKLIVSLRHGPGGAGRRVFPVSVEATLRDARNSGLALLHRAAAPSVQQGNRALGVSWTWLVLRKTG
jgi:SAM-dependent methyltransferase